MMFTEGQKAELNKPLNKAHVKPPAPGKYGEYIEGWRVIDEANRIFGFDGWDRETVDMIETNRDLLELQGNSGPYKQWRVGYRAKVRIIVTADGSEVIRDGTGFGSGQGKPEALGDVIESAIKEAETDAMKRALMTFGNPFGLALYDKTKANVAEAPKAPSPLIGDAECAQLATMAQASGNTIQMICEHYKVASLPELTADQFKDAMWRMKPAPQSKAA
jgi:DNA repair and recombination protein RAD52